MKKALPLAVAGLALLGGSSQPALARSASGCTVPRLFALTPAAARAQLTASGCRLGGVAFERPRARAARVTGQSPVPGAILPRGARVTLLVS